MDASVTDLLRRTLAIKAADVVDETPATVEELRQHAMIPLACRRHRTPTRGLAVAAAAAVAVCALAVLVARRGTDDPTVVSTSTTGWFMPGSVPEDLVVESVDTSIDAEGRVATSIRWFAPDAPAAGWRLSITPLPAADASADDAVDDQPAVDVTQIDLGGIPATVVRQRYEPRPDDAQGAAFELVDIAWSRDGFELRLSGPGSDESDLVNAARETRPSDLDEVAAFAEAAATRIRRFELLDSARFADGQPVAAFTHVSGAEDREFGLARGWVCADATGAPCGANMVSSGGSAERGPEIDGVAAFFAQSNTVVLVGWMRGGEAAITVTSTKRRVGLPVETVATDVGAFFRVQVEPGDEVSFDLGGGGGGVMVVPQPAL